MLAAGRLPLEECRLPPDWRIRTLVPVVVARRRSDRRLVVGVFNVDLGCVGVKSVAVEEGITSARYEALLASLGQPRSAPCEPSLAARVVDAGLRYADGLGIAPAASFPAAAPLLTDCDPNACADEVPCGRDGRPLYIVGSDDDAVAVLRHLYARCGPGGFAHTASASVAAAALPGDPEPVIDLAASPPRDRAATLARAKQLKHALVEFASAPWVQRAFLAEVGGDTSDDAVGEMAFDRYLTGGCVGDGRSVLEVFVDRAIGLSAADRAMVFGWAQRVDGYFRVTARGDDHLIWDNLVDGLAYRVVSHADDLGLRAFEIASLVASGLVPFDDQSWLVSGAAVQFGPPDAMGVHEAAAQYAEQHPEAVYRNPDRLERAWAAQRTDHSLFVQCFGSEEIEMPGTRVQGALRAFYEARAERRRRDESPGEPLATVPARVDVEPVVERAGSVGLVYDPVWGLGMYADYGVFRASFESPEHLRLRRHREAVRSYLADPAIDPAPFLCLARRFPDRTSTVFARVLEQPGFDWSAEGESLLRTWKPQYFESPPLPQYLVLGPELSDALVRHRLRGLG